MIALSFSFPHHGKYSSYHRLLAYLAPDDVTLDASLPRVMYRRPLNLRGVTQKVWRSMKEQKAWKIANSRQHGWVHYLYPEHGYFRGASLRRGTTKILMSCHLPEHVVETHGENLRSLKEGLSVADAMIVMSPDYVDYYRSFSSGARVAFIPHGVDTQWFYPQEMANREAMGVDILTVGNMLRDFETLAAVVNLAAVQDLGWNFHVVASKNELQKLNGMLGEKGRRTCKRYWCISDETLRDLYRTSTVLYLPLLGATANNAVVEAMACGLPMLLSDYPATRAYAGDTCVYIAGRDAEEAVEHIANLLSNREGLTRASALVRERAERELAWEVVVQRQRELTEGL